MVYELTECFNVEMATLRSDDWWGRIILIQIRTAEDVMWDSSLRREEKCLYEVNTRNA